LYKNYEKTTLSGEAITYDGLVDYIAKGKCLNLRV